MPLRLNQLPTYTYRWFLRHSEIFSNQVSVILRIISDLEQSCKASICQILLGTFFQGNYFSLNLFIYDINHHPALGEMCPWDLSYISMPIKMRNIRRRTFMVKNLIYRQQNLQFHISFLYLTSSRPTVCTTLEIKK